MSVKILIASPDDAFCKQAAKALMGHGCQPELHADPRDLGETALHGCDVLLLDLRPWSQDDVARVAQFHQVAPGVAVIAVVALEQRRTAVAVRKAGALDVVWTPVVDGAEVALAVRKGREWRDLYRENLHYRVLTARFPGVVFWGGTRLKIEFLRGRVQEVLGYAPEAFLEGVVEWDKLIHPADRGAAMSQMQQTLGRGEPTEVQFRIRRPDGALRWLEAILLPLVDEESGRHSVAGIVSDISGRKRAELQRDQTLADLQASKELLEKVFHSQRDAILISSAAQPPLILDCNPAACEIFGYDREELLGRTIDSLHTSAETLKRFQKQVYPAIAAQGFAHLEDLRMQCKSGALIIADVSTMPLTDEHDERIGWVSVVRDVTQQKHTEQVLSQRLQEQEALFVIGQLISSSLDLDTVLRQVAEHMSRLVDAVSCAISDWDPEAGTLTVQAEYIRPDQIDPEDPVDDMGMAYSLEQYPTTAAALRDHKLFVIYRDDSDSDPRERQLLEIYQWSAVAGIPLVVQNRVIGLAEVYLAEDGQRFSDHDLRLLQALANQVAVAIENARLFSSARANEASLRDLSLRLLNVQEQERRFIAQELHDELGQLLTATKISIDLAQRKLSQWAEDPEVHAIGTLRTRLEDASALTDKVLTNVRALTVELRPTLLDDMGVVPALRWYVGRFATRTDIQVSFEADEPPLRLPPAIETTIYRVVQEALTNVARHAQASQVRVEFHFSDDVVEVSVQDDGKGFDVEAWRRRAGGAQSLGLTGIQERAMLLDGRVSITSEPGMGTRLVVQLPVQL